MGALVGVPHRAGCGASRRIRVFHDAATKTANTRTVNLDRDTVGAIEVLRGEREPYGPWVFGLGPRS